MSVAATLLLAATLGGLPADGKFDWRLSAPLFNPGPGETAVKDPTVVRDGDRWHLFYTVREPGQPAGTGYANFTDWAHADAAPRHRLRCWDKYFCAPQVFYFRPHRKWYLIYQVGRPDRAGLKLQPAFSTADRLDDPAAWGAPTLFFPDADPPLIKRWIDFWVICDDTRAWLYCTGDDGLMWRMWTPLADFPRGFGHPEIALKGDIFEASHTYRVQGEQRWLTVIEAQGPAGKRYYKAFVADSLGGTWQPLAASWAKPFAGEVNVKPDGPLWSDNISHAELLRASNDEALTIDPARLQFLIQGVLNSRKPAGYGNIPWQLGLLSPAPGQP